MLYTSSSRVRSSPTASMSPAPPQNAGARAPPAQGPEGMPAGTALACHRRVAVALPGGRAVRVPSLIPARRGGPVRPGPLPPPLHPNWTQQHPPRLLEAAELRVMPVQGPILRSYSVTRISTKHAGIWNLGRLSSRIHGVKL